MGSFVFEGFWTRLTSCCLLTLSLLAFSSPPEISVVLSSTNLIMVLVGSTVTGAEGIEIGTLAALWELIQGHTAVGYKIKQEYV